MKKVTLFFLVVAFIGLTACTKDRLPRATEKGKNTFGCKINGKLFVPSEEEASWSGPTRPLLVSNNHLDGFTLFAVNFSSQPHKSILIGLPYLKKTGLYELKVFGYGQYKLEYFFGPIYRTNNTYTGEVNITRCDTINHIYSGTFSFTAVDENTGKTVKVTKGRFDVKR